MGNTQDINFNFTKVTLHYHSSHGGT